MPFFFFAIWKTFLLLSLTLHSVEGDWNVVTPPQDQKSSGQLTAGSSMSTLDGGPSVEAAFNPISDPPINGEITSNKPFPATTGIDMSCSDPNHKSPIKIRARRGNNSPTSCPSFLVPPQDQQQQKPPKNPQQPIINDGGEEQGDNAEGPEQPARNLRWRPKVGPLQDPCSSEILALGLIPVCDSGYIGPTTVLTECRYWSPSRPCVPHRENLWCCKEVRLGRPVDYQGDYFDYDFDYPYYGIGCVVIPTNWHWNPI